MGDCIYQGEGGAAAVVIEVRARQAATAAWTRIEADGTSVGGDRLSEQWPVRLTCLESLCDVPFQSSE